MWAHQQTIGGLNTQIRCQLTHDEIRIASSPEQELKTYMHPTYGGAENQSSNVRRNKN